MYTDYNFYTSTYYGTTIPEDDFERFELKASDFLNFACSNKVKGNLPTKTCEQNKIKKGVCALADAFYEIDQRKTELLREGGSVKSITSGGESITYNTSILDTIINGGTMQRNQYLYGVLYPYMSGVCDKNGNLYLYEGI